jgi:magnesium chelatase family protein
MKADGWVTPPESIKLATPPEHYTHVNCELHGCPCGFFSDPSRECWCTGGIIQRYLGKISGPLLDRIDLHVEVSAVP